MAVYNGSILWTNKHIFSELFIDTKLYIEISLVDKLGSAKYAEI